MIEFVVFEIRAISIIGTFGCKLMDNANFGVAHVQYHVIGMRGVKSNPIFGFRMPMFRIQYVSFMELS